MRYLQTLKGQLRYWEDWGGEPQSLKRLVLFALAIIVGFGSAQEWVRVIEPCLIASYPLQMEDQTFYLAAFFCSLLINVLVTAILWHIALVCEYRNKAKVTEVQEE